MLDPFVTLNLGSKLALGSANFGLDYGLANESGKLSNDDLRQIVNAAEIAGIDTIDTAQAYGDSEQRLGSILKTHFQIITKIGVGLDQNYFKNSVHQLVGESLKRLNQQHLYGVMLHRPEILFGNHGTNIIAELHALKDKGMIKNIGVSIYAPDILEEIFKLTDLDIVQVPFNLFDQRILKSGWSERLKERGVTVHVRSVFLQGLLLMKREDLPPYFSENWQDLFDNWYVFQKNTGVSAAEGALGFALRQTWINKIVVGLDSVQQLNSLVQIEAKKSYSPNPNLTCFDLDLIDPSNWKLA